MKDDAAIVDWRRLLPSGVDLTAVGMIVFLSVCWTFRANGQATALDATTLALLSAAIWVWGRLLLRPLAQRLDLEPTFPLVFLGGTTGLGVSLSFLRLMFSIDVRWLFGAHLVVGLAGYALDSRRQSRWRASSESAAAGLAATLISFVAATFWVQHYFPPTAIEGDSIIYKPIRDNFIHAQQVILLATQGDLGEIGRYGLAGEKIPFYHYASYPFPAVLEAFSEQTALQTTISLWLPLSLAVVGLAAFALAQQWFGSRGALWCLVGLLVIPDPSFWTFGVWDLGFYCYSFFRFLQIAPSNAYGIAVSGLGLLLTTAGIRRKSYVGVFAGIAVAGAALFFKAQVFVASFPLCALLGFGAALTVLRRETTAWVMRRPSWVFSGLIAATILTLAAFSGPLKDRVPILKLENPPGKRIAEFLYARTIEDAPVDRVAAWTVDAYGLWGVGLRKLLVLFVTFRFGLVVTAAVAMLKCVFLRRVGLADVVALLSISIYVGYALLLAPNITGHPFGNPWDLQFVPFAWAYFVLAIWTVGTGRELVSILLPKLRIPLAVAVMLLAAPYWIGRHDTDDWQTGQLWAYLRIPQGLMDCCEYIRTHSDPADRFQDSEDDPYYLVEAHTERRSFVGWPVVGSYTSKDKTDEIFQQRLKEHEKIREARTVAELQRLLAPTRIRWYLLEPETSVNWPREWLDQPVYSSKGYRVYDLEKISATPNKPVR